MSGRRLRLDGAVGGPGLTSFRLPETLRMRGLLTPDEVAKALSVTRKEVFGLPIARQQITPKKIRYRVDAVEAYVQQTTRPQAVGFLLLAARSMDTGALTPGDVAKLLRMRRPDAVAFIAPSTRVSLTDLEARIVGSTVTPP
jgi:plasmid maintenance system antidote protein VapI